MKKIKNYFKGVGLEARRIRWPKRKQLWQSVGVVCVITVVSALLIYFEDWLAIQVMKGFETAFPSSSEAASSAVVGNLTAVNVGFDYLKGLIGGLFR